jgi:hypothetical protein
MSLYLVPLRDCAECHSEAEAEESALYKLLLKQMLRCRAQHDIQLICSITTQPLMGKGRERALGQCSNIHNRGCEDKFFEPNRFEFLLQMRIQPSEFLVYEKQLITGSTFSNRTDGYTKAHRTHIVDQEEQDRPGIQQTAPSLQRKG